MQTRRGGDALGVSVVVGGQKFWVRSWFLGTQLYFAVIREGQEEEERQRTVPQLLQTKPDASFETEQQTHNSNNKRIIRCLICPWWHECTTILLSCVTV